MKKHRHKRVIAFFMSILMVVTTLSPSFVNASDLNSGEFVSESEMDVNLFTDGESDDIDILTNDVSKSESESESQSESEAMSNVLECDLTEEQTDVFSKISLLSQNAIFSSENSLSFEMLSDEDETKVVESLQTSLDGQEIDDSVSFSVSVLPDAQVVENVGQMTVRMVFNHADDMKDYHLYHQMSDGSWESLSHSVLLDEATDSSYLEFMTDNLGVFAFVHTPDIVITDETSEETSTDVDSKEDADADTNADTNADTDADTNEEDIQIESDTEADVTSNNTVKDSSEGSLPDEVQPIIIDEFKVSFSSGASLRDGVYVWNPSDPMDGHAFVYRVEYSMSGIFSMDKGAFAIEFPLHILKDRDGNWADRFECPYILDSEITEDMEMPNFAYHIDEENNKAIIYNYSPHPTGDAGYIEFSYVTTSYTYSYVDGVMSTTVPLKAYATNAAATVTATDEAEPVSIDTHATLAYTQKKTPSYYEEWSNSWGEKPQDADEYNYLVWTIRSYINNNTSPYDFYLDDTFTDYEGEVVGYRFAGQSTYSDVNYVTNLTDYGERYDYVLTRYRKDAVADILANSQRYEVTNHILAKVSPVDHVDEDTTATSSKSWWYERRLYVYGPPGAGSLTSWAEKYGIYGKYGTVYDSEDVTDFTLAEFQSGEKESLDNLRYMVYGGALPYPWTLEDGAAGTIEDAVNGKFGQKNVDYELVDDTFYLDDTKPALQPEDYDITALEWTPTMRTAVFDEENITFKEALIKTYKPEDAVTIWVKTASGDWVKATAYDMATKSYIDVDDNYVKSTSGKYVYFQPGVKGFKLTCSNPYYRTHLTAYPEVSLKRTEHVLSIVGPDTGKVKISLTNQASFSIKQNGNTLFYRTVSGKDYIQGVVRESEIYKDVIKTKNLKADQRFIVTWRVSAQEMYTDQNGVHSIYQQDGVFYDLLPAGAVFDASSLTVTASDKELVLGDYEVSLTDNYRDSGRTLMTVTIHEPTSNKYMMTYDTTHSYDSIKDYGKNLLNSVAYETGNEKIAEGYPDSGGNITDKDFLKDLDKNTDDKKFLYAEARYEVAILVAANTGLKKSVKNSSDKMYSYETTVHMGEDYTYRIRLANDANTKSKDVVFFDSLENFYQEPEETKPTLDSDWYGTLKGINLSNLVYKGIKPVVYLSKIESMNIQNHHDLKEKINGERVWIPYDTFVETYGLAAAKAIAVDASKKPDGSDFVLDLKESMSFELYMSAPNADTTSVLDPKAYNNIYVERTALKESGGDINEIPQFYHQDYTTVHYRVVSDIDLKKVDATDMETPVKGVTYKLRGTSDYGTVYEEERISNRNGLFSFKNIEKGRYELYEVSCSPDWQLNTEVYTVIIDGAGVLSIQGLTQDESAVYLVADEPRVHADLTFYKRDSLTKQALKGVEFRLVGTSSYDNDVLLYESSNVNGKVTFSNLELGTYDLVEIKTVDGYIKSDTVWTVTIREPGVAFLYDGDTEVSKSLDGYYQVENEPYHSIRFLKSSTYGQNIYLEGAEFSLTGVSDYRTEVNDTAVSASADDGGLVVFDHLEPGTYLLKEIKAPDDHDMNPTTYPVVVHKDGTYEIEGLGTTKFGNANVYDFKNVKTKGTICVTKVWVDDKTNEERSVPDITISTQVPSKNPLGYTITYHANDGTFGDDTLVRDVVYNKSNAIVDGTYMEPMKDGKVFVGWYTDAVGGELVDISVDGIPANALTSDMTLYARYKTLVLAQGSVFCKKIPSTATSVEFVSEVAPEGATLIDVDDDGDGGIVAWMDGTTFKVSTQNPAYKVQANSDSSNMFLNKSGLTHIGLENLDISLTTDMCSMFAGCKGLTELDVTGFDTRNVTAMGSMFNGCTGLTKLNVTNFDTSKVTNMSGMFQNCLKLTELDVTNFDTKNVTTMKNMFYGCTGLTKLDLLDFDTSNVTAMGGMFYNCGNLTELDVTNFNTSKVTDMAGMFQNCSKLTELNVTGFDTKNVTTMTAMFAGCKKLVSIDLSSFDTKNVTTMNSMFNNIGVTSLDLSNFDTSNVLDMTNMFYASAKLVSLDLSSFNTSKVTSMAGMFMSCCKLSSVDLSSFDTSSVKNMGHMFCHACSLRKLDLSNFNTSKVTSMRTMFSYCMSLTSLNISSFNTSSVTTMQEMFYLCSSLKVLDLSSFNATKVGTITNMFNQCYSLTTIYVSDLWNRPTGIPGNWTFFNCPNLVGGEGTKANTTGGGYAHIDTPETPGAFTYKQAPVPFGGVYTSANGTVYTTGQQLPDISDGDTFSYEDYTYVYSSDGWTVNPVADKTKTVYSEILSEINGKPVTSLQGTFANCTSMTKAPVIPNSITNMENTFNGCTSLSGNIVINSALNAYGGCFANTSKLIVLLGASSELGGLASTATNGNVSVGLYTASGGAVYTDKDSLPSIKVGDTYAFGDYTYKYASSGWAVNLVSDKTKFSYSTILSEINGKPVTSMYQTFKGCTKLVNAPIIPSGVTNMQEAFYECKSLVTVSEIPNSVTNMQDTFTNCIKLTTISAIPSSVTNMQWTFHGCSSLVNIPLIPDSVINMRGTFWDCKSMVTPPVIPNSVTTMYGTFYGCTSLSNAPEIPSSVTNMQEAFYGCTSLTDAPVIPDSVTNLRATFRACASLVNAPEIPVSVTTMQDTFYGCTSLVDAPVIPNSVTTMQGAFLGCTSLITAPEIPISVTNLQEAFRGCTSLKDAPVISGSVTNMYCTFYGCKALTTAPVIPDSVTNMRGTFMNCTTLTDVPTIPSSVTNMYDTFNGCTALTGDVVINANPTTYTQCFKNTTKPITLSGSSTKLAELAATANKGNATVAE